MSNKKFKVVADGTYSGVKIFSPEGEDITHKVRSFTVSQTAGDTTKLTLEILMPEVEVLAELDE